jgi:hypothetical protein
MLAQLVADSANFAELIQPTSPKGDGQWDLTVHALSVAVFPPITAHSPRCTVAEDMPCTTCKKRRYKYM